MLFEIKKITKRLPVFWIAGMMVLLSIGLFYWNQYRLEQNTQDRIEYLQNRIQEYEDNLSEMPHLQLNIDMYQAELTALEEGGNTYLDLMLERSDVYAPLRFTWTFEGGSIPDEVSLMTNMTLQKIKDENIPPIYPLSYLANFYELGSLTEGDLQEWKNMNPQYPSHAWYHLWQNIQRDFPSYFILLMVVCLFGSYSQVRTKKKLYYGEKISSLKVFWQNFGAKSMVFFGISLIVPSAIVSILGLLNGFGSLNYLVAVGTLEMLTMHLIPLSTYLFQAMILFVFIGIFVLAFTQLIESLVNNSLVALVIEMIILLIGIFLLPFHKFNPFAYFHIDRVLTASFGTAYQTGNWGLTQGLTVLTVAAIMCLIVSLITTKFQERLT